MLSSRLVFLWGFALLQMAHAQFNFFDQMFGGQGHSGGHGQGQQQPQNVPSDSNWYRSHAENMRCDKYLCPDTLACVHFPHHCPCQFPNIEDKFEFTDGQRICISRGGFKDAEAGRKIELARKGLL